MATKTFPNCYSCCGAPTCTCGYLYHIFGDSMLCPDSTIRAAPVTFLAEFTVDKAHAQGITFDLDCLPDVIYAKFVSYPGPAPPDEDCPPTFNSPCHYQMRICFGQNYGDQPDFPDFRFPSDMWIGPVSCGLGSYGKCLNVSRYPASDTESPGTNWFARFLCDGVWQNLTIYPPGEKPLLSYTCSPLELVFHGFGFMVPGDYNSFIPLSVRLTLADDCSSPFPSPDPWWCTPEGCVRAASAPEDATGGPFVTKTVCLEGCSTGPKYWCLYGQCVSSPTSPHVDATGPFPSPAECASSCAGPATMVYVCTPNGCGSTSKAYAVMEGITWFNTLEDCQGDCASEWYCTDFGCIEWFDPDHPPIDATSGPYSTQSGCQADCAGYEGAGYYCNYGACGYYTSRPAGAVGPRYASLFACTPDCFISEPAPGLVMGPAPGSLEGLNNQPILFAATPPPMRMDETRRRITIPCIHLGEKIGDQICSPCQKLNELRACAIHGKCRRKGLVNAEAGEKECFSCEQYEPPVSR